eukprot:4497213-Prorocentrum_lima.AAC.1
MAALLHVRDEAQDDVAPDGALVHQASDVLLGRGPRLVGLQDDADEAGQVLRVVRQPRRLRVPSVHLQLPL